MVLYYTRLLPCLVFVSHLDRTVELHRTTAIVADHPRPASAANLPAAIWDISQPPKILPAGMAIVRIAGAPLGAPSQFQVKDNGGIGSGMEISDRFQEGPQT
jgi:hypothetical protein